MEAWTTGRPTDCMRHKLIMYLEYNGEEEAKNVNWMVPTGNECTSFFPISAPAVISQSTIDIWNVEPWA